MLSFLKKSRGLALETRNSFLKLRVSKYHSEECLPNTFFMILRLCFKEPFLNFDGMVT